MSLQDEDFETISSLTPETLDRTFTNEFIAANVFPEPMVAEIASIIQQNMSVMKEELTYAVIRSAWKAYKAATRSSVDIDTFTEELEETQTAYMELLSHMSSIGERHLNAQWFSPFLDD